MASPIQWTWVWVNSGSWWWTGRPGVLWFMELQRVGHDWATELKWTEYGYLLPSSCFQLPILFSTLYLLLSPLLILSVSHLSLSTSPSLYRLPSIVVCFLTFVISFPHLIYFPYLSLLSHLLVYFLRVTVYFPTVILLPPLRYPPPSFCHLLGSWSPLSLWPALNHLFLKKRKIRRFSGQWNYFVGYHNGGYMSWYVCPKFTACTTPRVDPNVNYGPWVVMHQESCHF